MLYEQFIVVPIDIIRLFTLHWHSAEHRFTCSSLLACAGYEDYDDFSAEAAIYWFANDWHGGQWSNLYSALSTSEFHPGPLSRGPEPETNEESYYEALETKFTAWGKEAAETWGDGYDSVSR